MITLYQYTPHWALPNVSPFCMKVEVFLQLARLPYAVKSLPDPRKSPKGKLPYIKDATKTISDSSLIIDYLMDQYHVTIDQGLTESQVAQSLSLQRLIEEHLYWVIVYSRWIEDSGWDHVKSTYFESLPRLLKSIIPKVVRRGVKRALFGQGLGRHSRDEIYQFGIKDLAVIKTHLQNHAFMIADHPTSVDATGYAFIANILKTPIDCPLRDYVREHDCFESYCKRMQDACVNAVEV